MTNVVLIMTVIKKVASFAILVSVLVSMLAIKHFIEAIPPEILGSVASVASAVIFIHINLPRAAKRMDCAFGALVRYTVSRLCQLLAVQSEKLSAIVEILIGLGHAMTVAFHAMVTIATTLVSLAVIEVLEIFISLFESEDIPVMLSNTAVVEQPVRCWEPRREPAWLREEMDKMWLEKQTARREAREKEARDHAAEMRAIRSTIAQLKCHT